jgi:hypothetical protein
MMIIFCILILLMISACTNQKSKFPQGAWKWVSVKTYSEGKLVRDIIPGIYNGNGVKIWAENHVNDIGRCQNESQTLDNYFGGTYKLVGNSYEETIQCHWMKGAEGKTVKGLLELKNDTLIQTIGVDDNWKLNNSYTVYKFVRMQ